jgi:hypothetical protein
MRPPVTSRRLALAAVLVSLCVPASASAAEQLVGLTADNQLLLFRSDSPSNLQGSVTVTGLATGETLLGIGYQESFGRIYAMGSTNRLYVVNPITGAALPVSTLPFSPPLNGDAFAFAVDNSTNLARSYSSSGQNLSVSVLTGQAAAVGTAYSYDPSDPGTGTTPTLSALAYSVPPTGSQGAAGLYAIDASRSAFVTAPTQQALIRTVGELGVQVSGPAGLVLTKAGTGLAALRTSATGNPQLYNLDISTGKATPISSDESRATIAYRSSSSASGDTPVISIADLGEAPDDETRPRVVVGTSTSPRATTLRSSGLPFTTSCNEACTVSGVLTVGKKKQTAVTGAVLATAGWVKLTAKLNSSTKSLLRSDSTQGFSLKVTVTDGAGNWTNVTTNGATRYTGVAPPPTPRSRVGGLRYAA